MRTLITLLASSFLLLAPASAMAVPAIGKPAPDFTAKAIDGSDVTISSLKGRIVVLEWNNPGCPFTRKHYDSGNMQQLQSYAKGKGATWLSVNSGAPGRQGNMTADEAKAYVAAQKAAPTHYILDPEGKIGALYGAKVTPHMFVIDAKGNLAYMGAIDNVPSPDPRSILGADNYVRDAIDSLAAGKPVKTASSQPYGCAVKYAD